MEKFGYDIDFDKMSCYPIIKLFIEKDLVYEYRANPLNFQLSTSDIANLKVLEELLVDTYWSYQDYLQLKEECDKIKAELKKLPKHIVIKRHLNQ